VVGKLLYIPACASKARRTLELSTATGYAAIYPANACEAFNGRVVSLENDSAMAARAQQNFQKAGIAHFFDIVGKTLNPHNFQEKKA
jgi:predicted O-methyltransferase YrrM